MDTNLCQQSLIILLLPLGAFIVQVFFSKKLPREGDWLPTAAIGVGMLISGKMLFVDLLGNLSDGGVQKQLWYPLENAWLRVGGTDPSAPGFFEMKFGILVDNLTVIMLFVVTVVSFLVHLYSWGYMHGEVRYNRFFAYLALFTFSMLGLCITSNLLFLFIFWELVGVCSYFLIGFYFEKKSAQNAAIKAFLTTRVGDLGFFLAILMIASVVGSLEFDAIFQSVQAGTWAAVMGGAGLAIAAILLFCGPIGKSAQFPLHVWLPDAMEGPTPVSALIHAATMVAAGVYLIGRMFPFMAGPEYFNGNYFESDPLVVVAMIGGITAIFAASIAFAQTDIKKVLAYSTISQLGYMMLGLGVGSLAFGLFHLFTHAMFKALLFLGSGSVIHAVHSNEMKDMGGLRRKLPITYWTFLIGTLAIAGLPFLSGFWSKEAILTQAMAFAQYRGASWAWVPFALGMVTAVMTAFYMFRMFFKTFHGEPRNRHAYEHAHESPWTMTVPLVVLAVLSVVCAYPFTGGKSWFESTVNSETIVPYTVPAEHAATAGSGYASRYLESFATEFGHAHHWVLGLSLASLALGVAGAWFFFGRKAAEDRVYGRPGTLLAPVTRALEKLWFVDILYDKVFVSAVHFCRHACGIFDSLVIDGLVNLQGHICRFCAWVVGIVDDEGVDGSVRGIGGSTMRMGRWFRRLQTGNLQQYIYTSVLLGAVVLVVSVCLIFYWVKNSN